MYIERELYRAEGDGARVQYVSSKKGARLVCCSVLPAEGGALLEYYRSGQSSFQCCTRHRANANVFPLCQNW